MTTEVKDERTERFKKAVAENDQEYLEAFTAGRDMAFSGLDIEEDAEFPQAVLDGYESGKETRDSMNESMTRNKVYVQPHALGGLEVITFGSDGTKNSARITIEAASTLMVVLNMWLTTMLQKSFFEAAEQAQQVTNSGIVIPGQGQQK